MYVFDVDQENFEKVVLEGSNNAPVVVDFWAPWCGPCQTLKPLLEKLAEEYAGKFILAKINSDENQELAGQYGVRGIPNVKAFYKGKVIHEFSGAQPESEIRTFLDKIIPSPAEELRVEAIKLNNKNELDAALLKINEALALEKENLSFQLDKARILVRKNQIDEAKSIVDNFPIQMQTDPDVIDLLTRIRLILNTRDLPDEATLLANISANANDLKSRINLANLYIGDDQYQQALEQLLEVIKIDRSYNDDDARKTMLSLFNVLGNQHALVRQYRKLLAALLN